MKKIYLRTYKCVIDTDNFPEDWDFDGTNENANDIMNEFPLDELFDFCDVILTYDEVTDFS